MTRNELLSHKEYWLVGVQLDLYAQLKAYMKENGMNRTQLAEKLGVTKGYVSQVLNGDFDHKISKLVELSLAIGLVPTISYKPVGEVLIDDEKAFVDRRAEQELVHA